MKIPVIRQVTLPVSPISPVLALSIADTLRRRGLAVSPELAKELGDGATCALLALDRSATADAVPPPDTAPPRIDEPSVQDRLLIGQTLRAIVASGRLGGGEQNAEVMDRVGSWLTETALADLKAKRAA